MMELLEMADDRVVGVRIDGKIREADIRAMVELVEAKLNQHDKLRAYVEVERLGGIELGALFEDLRMGLKYWDRFERKAAVTDAKWMAKVAEVVDPLFPWIQVRAFATGDRAAAIAWLSED